MNGDWNPAQVEVGAYLAGLGKPVSPSAISKVFDHLGLNSEEMDARNASSEAGKRRRRKG
jgi:hypothetical protein